MKPDALHAPGQTSTVVANCTQRRSKVPNRTFTKLTDETLATYEERPNG